MTKRIMAGVVLALVLAGCGSAHLGPPPNTNQNTVTPHADDGVAAVR